MTPALHSITFLCFLVALRVQSLSAGEPIPANQDSWITFLSHRTGDNLLYKMRPHGTNCEPIFGGPIQDAPGVGDGATLYREPHWTWQSPDRKFFASWTTDSMRPRRSWSLPFSLQLGRTDGTGATRVLAHACEEAVAWSPDGKRLAYTVSTDPESVAHSTPARMSRINLVAIDGTSEEMILELPDFWLPRDWAPDGKKLLLDHYQFINWNLVSSELVELDLAKVESIKQFVSKSGSGRRWQNGQTVREAIDPVSGALVNTSQGRYSPDGKFIAVVSRSVGRADVNAELGVIDRATGSYRKVLSNPGPLHGPICWSPDSTQILFARGLAKGDDREAMKPREGPGRVAGALDYGLGLWAIRLDASDERLLTTGWCPDWR